MAASPPPSIAKQTAPGDISTALNALKIDCDYEPLLCNR